MEIYEPAEDSYFLSKILKDEIPKLLKSNQNLTFFEVGCGSGLQLQTFLDCGIKKQNIFSCDINPGAVKYCIELGFNCVQSDLFYNVCGKFDVIIFNPPYLPEDFREPKDSKMATTGGKNGGEIINSFLKQAEFHLNNNGKIFIIASSLTKGINFNGYNKKLLGSQNFFYEELYIFELTF